MALVILAIVLTGSDSNCYFEKCEIPSGGEVFLSKNDGGGQIVFGLKFENREELNAFLDELVKGREDTTVGNSVSADVLLAEVKNHFSNTSSISLLSCGSCSDSGRLSVAVIADLQTLRWWAESSIYDPPEEQG